MPSDAKKKQAQKKKDAAKVRQGGKKTTTTRAEDGEKESSPVSINGSTGENGSTEISPEGNELYAIRIESSEYPDFDWFE